MKTPQALNPNNRDNVIVAATEASLRQRIRSLPEDMSPGAREVALLTSVTKAQASTIKPMGDALLALKKLGSDVWPGHFLVADKAEFNWRTAPWRRYVSFEDFYDRELAPVYGDYENFVHDHARVVRGNLTPDEAAIKARSRAEERATAMQARNAADVTNQRQHGGDRKSEAIKMYNRGSDIHLDPVPRGTSVEAALRRLRKPDTGRPDLHARVLAGELTANAAMIAAGFRKPRPRDPMLGLKSLRRAWKRASTEERQAFLSEVTS